MPVELTEKLLSNAAGWDVMKVARATLEQGKVLSSNWSPPLLRGVVQSGDLSFRASVVIKGPIDIENLCTCADARKWGKICAHVVAVGLHWLKGPPVSAPGDATSHSPPAPQKLKPAFRQAADGSPLALSITLPPNLPEALQRGKVSLFLKALLDDREIQLSAIPRERAYRLSGQDANLVEWLETLSGSTLPAMIQIDLEQFESLLPLLADHPNLTAGKGVEIKVSARSQPIALRAEIQSNGEILLTPRQNKSPARAGRWLYADNEFRPVDVPPGYENLWNGGVRIARSRVPEFLQGMWPHLAAEPDCQANFKGSDFVLEQASPRFHLELQGGLARLRARLQCSYGSRVLPLGGKETTENWFPDPDNMKRYTARNLQAEQQALSRLQKAGFRNAEDSFLELLGQDAVLNFFAVAYPRLQKEWQVSLDPRLEQSTAKNLERIEPNFRISSGVQWFDLGVVFASEGGQAFSPAEVQRLLLSGQSHTRLKNGKFALIDTGAVEELQQTLTDVTSDQRDGNYRIAANQAAFVSQTLAENGSWKVNAPPEWRSQVHKLVQTSGPDSQECPPLGPLEAVLRPYQKAGVAWLHFLRQNNFGGILADEMGLGKTLQALAYLDTAARSDPARPHLIVCPSSLVFNWRNEAQKFTPHRQVLAIQGAQREQLFDKIPSAEILITSYALLRRDIEFYKNLSLDTVILDEAQHIKNRQTQNAQTVKSIKAAHRIVLTGTPLENSVADLWSIFDFLMPGYLGSAADFRDRYEIPIVKHRDQPAQARLGRRLKPFLLRRLKKQVAADLPQRIEQVAYCVMNEEQQAVYRQIFEASRKEILEAADTPNSARGRMVALNALLRLRQACCDLRLLNLESFKPTQPSGKVELFAELLEEVIDGGHRALVFSQFVTMLTFLKEHLDAEQIPYCYLDGSTKDRGAVVNRFQNDASVPLFLISLKAGGTGLNLTGADTVFHFDPWWNPAVEDQATDRAHRIGQMRVVHSYKLITRDTVEEKILILQNRKRELTQSVLGTEEAFANSLSWQEIQELLT